MKLNEKHIENNVERLNIKKFDLEFEIDPLFSKMTEKFSGAGAKSLLLKSLPVNEQILIIR